MTQVFSSGSGQSIYKHRRASKEEADVWLAKGGTWSDGALSVWALGSTDSGVSWIVETEGKRIFHAGDCFDSSRLSRNQTPSIIDVN